MSVFTSQLFLDACQLHVGQQTVRGKKNLKCLYIHRTHLKRQKKFNWKKSNNVNQKSEFFQLEYLLTHKRYVQKILQAPLAEPVTVSKVPIQRNFFP